jgi:hypothetical protein
MADDPPPPPPPQQFFSLKNEGKSTLISPSANAGTVMHSTRRDTLDRPLEPGEIKQVLRWLAMRAAMLLGGIALLAALLYWAFFR